MDLHALADFILVARHGGFGRAARAAGRPKATLSRRVAELENSLNLRLVERGARLSLTDEGRALFERTSGLLTEIDSIGRALKFGGEVPRGPLRISAPLLFAQVAMGRLAAGFMTRYPEVHLEVTAEDRSVDMREEGYDLVIRVNPKPDESLVGRIFLRDRLVVVAAHGLPRTASEPVPAVVRDKSSPAASWILKKQGGEEALAVRPILALSSLMMIRDAITTGIGAACLPISLVSQDIARGTLVQWGDLKSPEVALWALYPSRRLLSPRVKAFLDYLKEIFPSGAPEELAAFLAK
ncbi:MAG TPA: LysR substrate-binding domain-containing protein [Cellvibrionaceae bacterium]|nr:LysR substrate-binding domain-containing protein [Cellvibrionaceae bacterium]